MSEDALLGAILSAAPAARSRVLQNCRLEGAGTEAYGRDGIAELFARAGLDAPAPVVAVCADMHALFAPDGAGGGFALFADVYDGFVARLWLCADRAVGPPRRGWLDVPFDPDLDQRGAGVQFDPADHPALEPADVAIVGEGAARLMVPVGSGGMVRGRPTVLRAFSAANGVAALVAMQGRGGSGVPRMLRYDVAIFAPRDGGGPIVITDAAGLAFALAQPWEPRL